ncbi:MAG: ABC transporter substrate-binding protein [Alphaproteobacteria bacterium]|nr:ABC transporter substrate-binding protein [Alphaproteobacteria bacterium]
MRRLVVASVVALIAALGSFAASAETVLKVVMHSDVKALDPIWSGAYITRNFGYMIYDTLFAIDEKFQVKPQMVDTWNTSDDGLVWTFKLRDGLEWHDGTPVTSDDCIASIKRWASRDAMGQKMASVLSEYKAVDPKTFQIVLKQKFGPLLEALGKPSVVVPFMMPKKMAEVDAFTQSDNAIGSGPFIFKKEAWKPGEKLIFVKNPKYKPRSEPMSGLSGGKVVNIDRVEWIWIPDAETQVSALINGEIDMIESLDYDHIPVLEKTKGVRIVTSRVSNQYVFRMNWLTAPFNNVKVRQAAAYALSEEEFLQANIGDKRFYRTCKAMFTCDSPYASTAGMDGLIEGNVAKAKELLAEAKYDGTVVVIPQPTDLGVIKQLAPVAKAQLERAGFKVDVQPMDWQSMVTRLTTKKGLPSEGGWSAFGTSWSQVDILDPLMTPNLAATCEKARAGWPCDPALEKLRDKFVQAETPEEKKAAADAVQTYAMQVVTHVPLGEWFAVSAVRDNVVLPAVLPPVTVFWGASKK